MNDWLPEQLGWVTTGYEEYKRKRKRKHSNKLFEKYITEKLFKKGIDLHRVSSGKSMFFELFWQCECLKEWCFTLSKICAALAVETSKKGKVK